HRSLRRSSACGRRNSASCLTPTPRRWPCGRRPKRAPLTRWTWENPRPPPHPEAVAPGLGMVDPGPGAPASGGREQTKMEGEVTVRILFMVLLFLAVASLPAAALEITGEHRIMVTHTGAL